jgi:NADPH-dependent 2,4-dienoyl-CoA reductase/sulfur reductase-like enzyme
MAKTSVKSRAPATGKTAASRKAAPKAPGKAAAPAKRPRPATRPAAAEGGNGKGKPLGSVLVVGAGIAGIQSSLDLAESGYKVYLVE